MDLPEHIRRRLVYKEPFKNEEILPLAIDKIVNDPEPCVDCGMIITERKVLHRVNTVPQPHWKHTCQACGNYRNPETGKWDLSRDRVDTFYKTFFRRRNK